MAATRFDVLGIGNAIVDVIARADDDFLVRQKMRKGTMQLIDEVRAMRLDFSRTGLKPRLADVETTQRAFRGKCVQQFGVQL